MENISTSNDIIVGVVDNDVWCALALVSYDGL